MGSSRRPKGCSNDQDGQRFSVFDAFDHVSPDRKRAETRKWHIARGQHLRQQNDTDRLDSRHSEQDHHRGAVHRKHLVAEVYRPKGVDLSASVRLGPSSDLICL